MAFNAFGNNNAVANPFGSAPQNAPQNVTPQAQTGPDLEDIQTEALGFLTIAGEAIVQLLPTPWPHDNLPPSSSSLLSIASKRGLIAAAGPDAIIIADTNQARNAFQAPKVGDSPTRPFQPQLILPMSQRISQVAFTADEQYLILAAEIGGGLAVYEVQALLNGTTQPKLELSTQSIAVKSLAPNPTQEKGESVAVVLTDGKLMIANLNEGQFVNGSNGPVLREGVTCASWSTRGKQLVAGLQNGTAIQMTPDGVEKALIPEPPGGGSSYFVSSISWLENNVFLTVHTPNSPSDEPPSSTFHVVTRNPPAEFLFQKISEPAGPFGMNRSPPNHFLLRLKEFPPNLQDLLIVASTASTDIGLFSRSKAPLASDKPADRITGVFTMTEMADDTRRAQLPVNDSQQDTSPIGLALDLSSTAKVTKPIPGDEMEESQTPLPALMVLNNEGVLAAWWIVYSASVQQGTIYPELVAAGPAAQQQKMTTTAPNAFGSSIPSALVQPTFGSASMSKPSTPAFGSGNAFGAAAPAFGAGSGLGKSGSVWGSPSPATSKIPVPAGAVFGSSTTFGSAAVPGASASPWGKPASSDGNSFSSAAKTAGVFGGSSQTGGGFASLGKQGGNGFSSLATGTSGTSTLFGGANKNTDNASITSATPFGSSTTPFGGKSDAMQGFTSNKLPSNTTSASDGTSLFGQRSNTAPSSNGVFGQPQQASSSSLFGNQSSSSGTFASQPFTLGSTFKSDETAKDDVSMDQEPASKTTSNLFDNTFTSALTSSEARTTNDSPETEMKESVQPASTTPVAETTVTKNPFSFNNTTTSSKTSTSTTAPTNTTSSLFAAPKPSTPSSLFTMPVKDTAVPKSPADLAPEAKQPELPLPPLSTSKSIPPSADNSPLSSPGGNDAPLPPDFMSMPAPKKDVTAPAPKSNPTLFSNPMPQTKKAVNTSFTKESSTIFSNPRPSTDSGPGLFSNLVPVRDLTSESEDPDDDEEEEEEEEEGEVERTDEEEQEESAEEELKRSDADQSDSENSGFQSEEDDGGNSDFDGSGEDVAADLSPKSSEDDRHNSGSQSFTNISKPFKQASKPENQQIVNRSKLKPTATKDVPLSFGSPSTAFRSKLSSSARKLSVSDKSLKGPIPTGAPAKAQDHSQNHGIQPNRSGSGPGRANIRPLKKATGNPSSTYLTTLEQKESEEKHREQVRAKHEKEEAQALVDDEDENIQRYLEAPLEPTRILDEFTAHQDYSGAVDKNSTPAQIESVFRDINSMIDNLGINARALKSFILGHEESSSEQRRHRHDLQDAEDWCLGQTTDLESIITQDLTDELEQGRVVDIAGKTEDCDRLERELSILRIKAEHLDNVASNQTGPDGQSMAKLQPLTTEQAAMQNDLRRNFTSFQQKLSETEEALTILRAKLAAKSVQRGKTSAGPTVEAVMRTIVKMTSMAEKRSGDVDVLETQMRNLRMGSHAPEHDREGSPFNTPSHRRSLLRVAGNGEAFNRSSIARESTPSRFGDSIMSTMSNSRSSPARKKMSGFTEEEKSSLRSKAIQRKRVTDRLRAALQASGTKIRSMDEEDDIQ